MHKTIKITITAALTLALLAPLLAQNATAIVNGTPDGTDHPYVGMMLFTDGTYTYICSGSLIAPKVFLTAGHCTIDTKEAWISFEPEPFKDPAKTYHATTSNFKTMQPYYQTTPGVAGIGTTYDVGIVILDKPAKTTTLAKLPTTNQAATLPQKATVSLVGYGVTTQLRGHGITPPNSWTDYGTRMQATAQIIQSQDILNANYLKITANIGNDKGTTMFGDSGGPVLTGDTVLAVTSFGLTYNRGGTSYYSRTDNPAVLDWIQQTAGTLLK